MESVELNLRAEGQSTSHRSFSFGVMLVVSLAVVVWNASCAGPSPVARSVRPNVLLVSIDTLRADRVGLYGGAGALTPNIDRIGKNGVVFETAISVAPLTLPSHATIMTGLLPVHHGVRNNGATSLSGAHRTLAATFRSSGYKTAAFVGAFVLDRRYGLDQGFDHYDDEIDRDEPVGGSLEAERDGGQVVDRAFEWIGNANGPFFAWVHLYDPHAPYTPPEPYRSSLASSPYDGEIAYADHQLGRLLSELDQKGIASNTIVIVVGDHGESLGEHGELTHGLLLFEPTLRVPFVISGPGLSPDRRIVEPVSLADLAPTVEGLAGVDAGAGKVDGRDLSDTLRRGDSPPATEIYSETRYPEMFGWSGLTSLRRGNWKLISSSEPRLFDLANDPAEATNVLDAERRIYHTLSSSLDGIREGEVAAPPRVAPDPEALARLESLGYVGGTPPVASGPLPDPHRMAPLFRKFEEATWASADGRYDDAIATLGRIVDEDPRNPVFRGSLAKVLRTKGDFVSAVALYQEAVALAPSDAEAWYNLAVTLGEAGRPADSGEALVEAIRRDDRRPEAHNALGIILASQGKAEEAIEAFERAIALDPRNARAKNNLGNTLRDIGRYDDAVAAYQGAVALDSDYADPLNGLGVIEIERDHPREAIAYFDRAFALAPSSLEVRLNRGIAYELAGERQAAIDEYREFLRSSDGRDEFASQRSIARQLLQRLQVTASPS